MNEQEGKRQRKKESENQGSEGKEKVLVCTLTQHNVRTIVLKLAAVGYSAEAFPCKACRMKPRQRGEELAAGAADLSVS